MTASGSARAQSPADSAAMRRYNAFLLLVAGLGGLLYGIDVGIIGGAVPYLQATSGLTASQLSVIVAAVLLGSVFSTLFSGLLADWMGRKPLMILSGCAFVLSIPVIALSQGYGPLFFGRLLQGMSGGLIGVVVPLYLAECLAASSRGKGTAIFQWMLTLGIVAAALIGHVLQLSRRRRWRSWAMPRRFSASRITRGGASSGCRCRPALCLCWAVCSSRSRRAGCSGAGRRSARRPRCCGRAALSRPRWNLRRWRRRRTRPQTKAGQQIRDSLLRRKYVIPFLLACVILFCNTATGVNSIIGYNTGILLQSGLSDLRAHWGYVIFTVVNFLVTTIGMMLVDRKGRKFLLVMGTSGVIVAMVGVALLFRTTEKLSVDCRGAVQALVGPEPGIDAALRSGRGEQAAGGAGHAGEIDAGRGIESDRASLAIIYSYGGFTAATSFVRSDDAAAAPIEITRASCVPANRIEALFKNPFADLAAAQTAPLVIQKALVGRVPEAGHGWLVALGLYVFIAFYAMGPGVVVWLALSELMPTRIRSNGMSIALVINQLVSTTLAAIFLPFVSKHGYSSMFFLFAGFTVVYFLVAVFFLPETKGKTLEEIEAHFASSRSAS